MKANTGLLWVRLSAIFIASLVFERTTGAADQELGTYVHTGTEFSNFPNTLPEAKVFKDAQGSYYTRLGPVTTKLNAGEKLQYKDSNGVVQTVTQPTENNALVNAALQTYSDTQFASLLPTLVSPGDTIFSLAIPNGILTDIAALDPPLFGDTATLTPTFYSFAPEIPNYHLILGSVTSDGLTPTVFALDVASEWLQFSDLNLNLSVVSSTREPDEAKALLYTALAVPESGSSILFLATNALLLSLIRFFGGFKSRAKVGAALLG